MGSQSELQLRLQPRKNNLKQLIRSHYNRSFFLGFFRITWSSFRIYFPNDKIDIFSFFFQLISCRNCQIQYGGYVILNACMSKEGPCCFQKKIKQPNSKHCFDKIFGANNGFGNFLFSPAETLSISRHLVRQAKFV